jgi:hypothetical protein
MSQSDSGTGQGEKVQGIVDRPAKSRPIAGAELGRDGENKRVTAVFAAARISSRPPGRYS